MTDSTKPEDRRDVSQVSEKAISKTSEHPVCPRIVVPALSQKKDQSLTICDANEIKWANHLLDEWKYRHEGFWKTLYRSLSAIAVLVTIPFVKADFLKPIRGKGIGLGLWSLMYTFLPFILFAAMCLLLASDYAKLRQVERHVKGVRGRYQPDPPDELEAFKCGWPTSPRSTPQLLALAEKTKEGAPLLDGWPIQARFWLEWGCSHVTDLVRHTN